MHTALFPETLLVAKSAGALTAGADMRALEFDYDWVDACEWPVAEPPAEKQVSTPEEVRAQFKRTGVSIAGWAAANGFTTGLVFDLLAGRKQGLRGQAHNAAVLLGLKQGEICTDPAGALR